MKRVLCEVDGSPADHEAVRAAIAFCLGNGAELELLGVVKKSFFDPPQPAVGERIRRYQTVRFALDQAEAAAREAGLVPTATVRVGDPVRELEREAKAIGATEGFLAREHGRVAALLRRVPRIEVEERRFGQA